ncbi:rab GTPase-binding effector protein 1-like isoform X1 [Daphnia pulicaria]|uniref:rab GTPase-binding effector protein 1-like isoform X1 n=1 Tax=Daphnia pulicaria TaxID=35523 RepID=UPI001EECAD57|nr:rab GTPase-binding effector protein 1-like isoform X1 [Daphnia pulicaria]
MAENSVGSSLANNCADSTDSVVSSILAPVTKELPGNHEKEIRRLQFELDEARSLAAVANYSLEESIETERRKCQEEVATLQQLMKENIQEAVRQTQENSDAEIRRLKNIVTRLELEVHDLRSSSDRDNPNVFSAVTKTLARKVGNLTNPNILASQTPAPVPLVATASTDSAGDDYLEQSMKRAQEDVEVLRSLVLPLEEEIKALKDKLRYTDEQLRVYESNQAELVRGSQLLDKIVEDESLESAITDLISRTGMNTEDSLPHRDFGLFLAIVNAQRATLQEERERLRSQMQEACQLLEQERRQHRELRRSLQKNNLHPTSQNVTDSSKDSSKGFPIKDRIGPLISRISPVLKRKSSAQSPSKDISADSYVLDPATFGTPEMVTRQMTKEDLENMSSCSVDSNLISSEGNSARIEDGNQNTRFKELEADFQQMQEEKVQLDKQLTKAREEARMLSDLIKDMEHKWTEVAKDYEKQVDLLYGNIEDVQSQLKSVTSAFKKFRNQAQETLRQLQFDRQSVSTELVRLQEENDFLVGKHSLHAEQLQNEMINLPDNLQELQYVCLNLREDFIAAKVAKEALERKWQMETLVLKNQLLSEQQSKETLENSLTGEIDYLREQLGMMRSVQTQLDEESSRKASLEAALLQAKEQLADIKDRASESISSKAKMEHENQQLKNRVSALQADLETSEAVQRDFVQLSQQLQVQLEKIRQSEKELRWQYEEDIDQCAECRQAFGVAKRKHHCRHCCQIFCGDCLRKTVTSGPNKRQSRVCNVCFYLLVQESAPFFSSEPKPSN